jgi:hypothetical protein
MARAHDVRARRGRVACAAGHTPRGEPVEQRKSIGRVLRLGQVEEVTG